MRLQSKIQYPWLPEASRYADFITTLNYKLLASDNIYFERQLSHGIFILQYTYSSSTTNCLLESETYDHKYDSFAVALAHNGIVSRFTVLHD